MTNANTPGLEISPPWMLRQVTTLQTATSPHGPCHDTTAFASHLPSWSSSFSAWPAAQWDARPPGAVDRETDGIGMLPSVPPMSVRARP